MKAVTTSVASSSVPPLEAVAVTFHALVPLAGGPGVASTSVTTTSLALADIPARQATTRSSLAHVTTAGAGSGSGGELQLANATNATSHLMGHTESFSARARTLPGRSCW